MFNEKDFENIQKSKNQMADGLTDGSSSHEILEEVISIMASTDFSSDESRMEFMMNCINICFDENEELDEDKTYSLVLALCFSYSNIVSNLVVDGFNIDEYYNFLQNEVLPVMKEESKNLPYWDFNE